MVYLYTDATVYRMTEPKALWTTEAFIDGAWKSVFPSERDLETMRPITEAQADELNATPPNDRVRPDPVI